MARWDQKHRDTATLEERRLKGVGMLRAGTSQSEVARRLAVSPVAVHYWKLALEAGGTDALRAIPRPGRPPNVPRERLEELPRILARGALSYGFSTDLWTIPRILDVTEAEWGVRYDKSAMWRLLKRHGLSWQRPSRQAREKNLVAVRNWKQRTWPRLKKKPTDDGP